MPTAIYLRQSLDRDGQGVAIERQRAACRDLCTRKGWAEPIEYVDNDRSATKGTRPAYQQLVRDIEAGAVTAVVAWAADRLHRRPIELEQFIAIADQRNVSLATCSGDLDLATPQGKMLAGMMANVARYEVEHKSLRQMAALKQKASLGHPTWTGKKVFGYRQSGKRTKGEDTSIELEPTEAAMVRDAYDRAIAGELLGIIAKEWNAAGYVGSTGKPWRTTTMRAFLTAPRNAGLIVYRDQVIGRGTWPAIVSEDTWREAVTVIQSAERRDRVRAKLSEKYLLSGVLRCSLCDDGGKVGGVRIKGQRNGSETNYYRCNQCDRVRIPLEPTDDMVIRLIAGRLAQPDAAAMWRKADVPRSDADNEISELRSRMASLGDAFADGLMTAEQVNRATTRMQERLDELAAQAADAEKAQLFAGIPTATGDPDGVRARLEALPPDRLRSVIAACATLTLTPRIGPKGFDPQRVKVDWR